MDFRMGQPDGSDTVIRFMRKLTRGTETSQYPEEKKTKVIAQVVASERALAQTTVVATLLWGCRTVGSVFGTDERKCLESHTAEGESPVCEECIEDQTAPE